MDSGIPPCPISNTAVGASTMNRPSVYPLLFNSPLKSVTLEWEDLLPISFKSILEKVWVFFFFSYIVLWLHVGSQLSWKSHSTGVGVGNFAWFCFMLLACFQPVVFLTKHKSHISYFHIFLPVFSELVEVITLKLCINYIEPKGGRDSDAESTVCWHKMKSWVAGKIKGMHAF